MTTELVLSDPPTEAEMQAAFLALRNWGRWGAGDQLGTLNLLTPECRRRGAASVVDGHAVSLAHDLAVMPTAENPFPGHHHMVAAGDARENTGLPGYEASRDYVGCHVHGLGITHVDALCHMFVGGEMYNGVPASEVRSDGARANTIMTMASGVVGRGVLIDVPRALGVAALDGHRAVRRAELEAAEDAGGVRVEPGDIVLVSTGRDARRHDAGGVLSPAGGMAGLHPDCLGWLRERDIAVLGSDGISDPMPGVGTPNWPFPVHQIGIAGLGLPLIDNLALGELAEACAERGRWSVLFTMGPLRVPGGTGCPVNPTAVL